MRLLANHFEISLAHLTWLMTYILSCINCYIWPFFSWDFTDCALLWNLLKEPNVTIATAGKLIEEWAWGERVRDEELGSKLKREKETLLMEMTEWGEEHFSWKEGWPQPGDTEKGKGGAPLKGGHEDLEIAFDLKEVQAWQASDFRYGKTFLPLATSAKKTALDENSFFANGTNHRVPLC